MDHLAGNSRPVLSSVLGRGLRARLRMLFGLSPVNTHVLERPLALFFNRRQTD